MQEGDEGATMTLTGFVYFLHVLHHGSTAVRLAVFIVALVALWVVLKCVEFALIPE
jgi:hypothetical protein